MKTIDEVTNWILGASEAFDDVRAWLARQTQ